jgi:hypothetical protein
MIMFSMTLYLMMILSKIMIVLMMMLIWPIHSTMILKYQMMIQNMMSWMKNKINDIPTCGE